MTRLKSPEILLSLIILITSNLGAVGANPKPSIGELQAKANSGDPKAQFELSTRYGKGEGVPIDLKQAAIWVEKAASQGLPEAEMTLGQYYEDGIGVQEDVEKAKSLYLKAANHGNAQAAFNISAFYFTAKDYRTNDAVRREALHWLERSAELGSPGAAIKISEIYFEGKQTKQDYQKAFKWNSVAARRGDICAAYRLACLYDQGKGVAQDQREAAKWYEKSSVEVTEARRRLRQMYSEGIGVPKDPEKLKQLEIFFAKHRVTSHDMDDTLFPTSATH
ncbi:MAG TPA: tetratricopeptide repeat protein [Oculatellaceae cyanobacterium]